MSLGSPPPELAKNYMELYGIIIDYICLQVRICRIYIKLS
jgi:hypothetical protein